VSGVPRQDLARVAVAQAKLLAVIQPLDDADVRRSSRLPGWTVGHVLSHLARNADSHRRRAEAAMENTVIDQYQGGWEGRKAEIDAGADRPAAALVDDVRLSAQQMDEAWRRAPEAAWNNVTRDVGGTVRPLSDLPARRWQELEVHLVDLGLGATFEMWPDDFVATYLPVWRATMSGRLGGQQAPPTGLLDEREELAWLYGRLQRADLPDLTPW
jgi:maleylpyruvate isomerase